MSSKSRVKNSVKNMAVGLSGQAIMLTSSFINRTFFIRILGVEYLGISGLYSNILTILSLAELGIENVMIFSLYKPVADDDQDTISALLYYYKKVYLVIAFAVFLIGVSVLPFLDKIVNSDLSYRSVTIFYLLFLFNSVISYFVAYKAALINANQKIFIIKSISTVFSVAKDIVQLLVLTITNSYYLYLLVQITFTILNNVFLSFKANKLYPFILSKGRTTRIDNNVIKEGIKSTFLYKIGVVAMNNTDNILISAMVGTIYVGYYSNYGMIVSTVTLFIGICIQSLSSSIGSLNAEGNMQKSYKFFRVLLLFFHWLSTCFSLCFLLVLNDIITVWIGKNYLLGIDVVIIVVISFYIQNVINPVWIYRESMGMFRQIKYVMIIAAIINLSLSVVLGKYFGVAGILLSTVIGRILTTVWYEPKLLFNTKFKQPLKNYWLSQFKYFLISIFATVISLMFCRNMPTSLFFIILKIAIAVITVSALFLIVNIKSEEIKTIWGYTKRQSVSNKQDSII